MSVLFGRHRRRAAGQTAADVIPRRPDQMAGTVPVTNETALRHSAVWACLRLRANLVSTMPVDLFRRVDGVQIEVPKPPVLSQPGGERVGIMEWLYSSQFDLDRAGNCFGLITARDGLGHPSRIELQPVDEVTVRVKDGKLRYVIGRQEYDPSEVWHERQYTVSGLPIGLSPVAYAAWSIGEYLSIQEFALNWFGNGAVPQAHLRNQGKKTVTPDEAALVKERFRAATQNGDMFVSGADWEYKMIQAEQAGADWIAAKNFGIGDIARFFDCPGDLIDAAVSSGSITYASMTQRNLQFLIMHLGPAVARREDALGRVTSRPRFVKLNASALLRMDPKTRADMLKLQIDSRTLAPSEARALEDRPPFTDAQLLEFDRLFGPPKSTPAGTAPATPTAPTGATS